MLWKWGEFDLNSLNNKSHIKSAAALITQAARGNVIKLLSSSPRFLFSNNSAAGWSCFTSINVLTPRLKINVPLWRCLRMFYWCIWGRQWSTAGWWLCLYLSHKTAPACSARRSTSESSSCAAAKTIQMFMIGVSQTLLSCDPVLRSYSLMSQWFGLWNIRKHWKMRNTISQMSCFFQQTVQNPKIFS